jgi:hypothetical protein
MRQHYDDILSRISEPPRWFDEGAVPRYCEFHPKKLANIYSVECALVEVSCQFCKKKFLVAVERNMELRLLRSRHEMSKGEIGLSEEQCRQTTLADLIRNGELHYGDPPNVRCCGAGPTATSIVRRIVEYWARYEMIQFAQNFKEVAHGKRQWERDRTLEVEFDLETGKPVAP